MRLLHFQGLIEARNDTKLSEEIWILVNRKAAPNHHLMSLGMNPILRSSLLQMT